MLSEHVAGSPDFVLDPYESRHQADPLVGNLMQSIDVVAARRLLLLAGEALDVTQQCELRLESSRVGQ